MRKKVIFLDIDGVLNAPWSHMKNYKNNKSEPLTGIYKQHTKWLNYILKKTNAYIVISSTWRITNDHKDLRKKLVEADVLDRFFGTTPVKNTSPYQEWVCRGDEIREWIEDNSHIVSNYIILDDRTDMLKEQHDRFVRVDSEKGLSFWDARKAVKILNDETKFMQ